MTHSLSLFLAHCARLITCGAAGLRLTALHLCLLLAAGAMGVARAGDVVPPPRVDIKPKLETTPGVLDPSIRRLVQFVTVPNVVKFELSQAQATLTKYGFQHESIALDQAGGRRVVERTDPGADSRHPLAARPVVKLYHRAEGPPPAQVQRMPSLLGMTCEQARQTLAQLRRRVDACEPGTATGDMAPGRINAQQPRVDSVLAPDASVRVSTEPDYVVVPGVVGLNVTDAAARVNQARLRPETGGVTSRWYAVQSQEPPAGRRVPPQSVVRLVATARYVVPDITGLSCARAQVLVNNAGLGPFTCRVEAGPGNTRPGAIYSQSPAPRTELSTVQPVQAVEQPALAAVPNVVGQPEAAAVNLIAQFKLRAVPAGPAASAGRYVAAQSPAPGTMLTPGREVTITLELSVPPLTGLDCDGALARARAHGFDNLACERKLAGLAQPLHRVFDQRPAAGTRTATPVSLRVVIALPVTVPNVVGQNLRDAQALLAKAALKGQPDAGDGDRDVVAQRPAAGTEAAPGALIALTTQRFERVPAVTGMLLPDARTRLQQAKFGVNADHNDRATGRRVDRQSPAAGERLALGQTVALYTHIEVEVPDVVKQPLTDAMRVLTQRGLTARPDREDNATDREVRTQRPAAGTKVAEQSDVALTTVRLVAVPDLTGASCNAAMKRASSAGLTLGGCSVQSISPLVLGEPVVKTQSLALNTRVDEGTLISAQAEAPWWSAPLQLATLLSLGGWLGWRFWHRGGSGTSPPPVPPTLPAAVLTWRVAPDADPPCNLRMAPDADDTPPSPGEVRPRVRWRLISPEAAVCLRSREQLEGDDRADPH